MVERPGQPGRRDPRLDRARREGQALRARGRPRRAARAPARACTCPSATSRSNGEPVAGAFVDFGLYVHRNAEALLERGAGPYFYIPKLESQREAALWRDAFVIAEEALGLDRGTIKATVLIETIPAAFEMDAILYELRDHAAGLNAGRWDYIFSVIKRFRSRPDFVTAGPLRRDDDRPVHERLLELLVKTCHARGAHAMGGMSAVIPSRTDEEANKKAFEAVRGRQGARGRAPASTAPGSRTRTRCRWRRRRSTRCSATGPTRSTSGATTCSRRRRRPARGGPDARRGHRGGPAPRTSTWASSTSRPGCAATARPAIYGLMEDAATAEISRAPGVAVDPPRRGARRRPPGHARPGARAGHRGAGEDPRARSATTTGSRSRAAPTCRARCSSAWRSAATSSWSS